MNTTLTLTWSGGMKGSGQIEGANTSMAIAIPAVYGGAGTGSNPKELYIAATAACFISTLTAMIEGKHLPATSWTVQTDAEETKERFTITHCAAITLAPSATEEDQEKARAIIASADKVCVVGNLARKAGVEVSAKAVLTLS